VLTGAQVYCGAVQFCIICMLPWVGVLVIGGTWTVRVAFGFIDAGRDKLSANHDRNNNNDNDNNTI